MCRIDASFDVSSLDEKSDPVERFKQALDEYKAEGKFRDLLIKHFADNWKNVFRDIYRFEEALSNIEITYSDAEKCTAFLLSQKSLLSYNFFSHIRQVSVRNTALLDFLDDVKQIYYPDSPFDFYISGMDKVVDSYYLFVSLLYGKDFCFSKGFFDDKSLNALNRHERSSVLWDYFYSITPNLESRVYPLDKNSLLKEFTSIASLSFTSGPPTEITSEILRGFEFIKVWIKFDSQAGRLTYCWFDFIYAYNSPWDQIEKLLRCENSGCDESSTLLSKWLEDRKLEFEKLTYVSADLKLVSDEGKEQWASGLDNYHMSYSNTHILRADVQPIDDYYSVRPSNAHHELCSELTPLQILTWITYSVKDDFKTVLNSNQGHFKPTFRASVEKWCCKGHSTVWKKVFLESLSDLTLEDQLLILSASVPVSSGQSESFDSDFSNWWDELFNNLIEKDDFPKELTPGWTVIAIGRLDREILLPWVDRSIGILRGELSKSEANKEEINTYHQYLESLLTTLDRSSPVKAQKHRLLLMRSSTEPFSDEKISKLGSPFNHEIFRKWYDSLKQLAATQLDSQINSNRAVTAENNSQIKNDFYIAFSHELAEFCLSRLRLRKGEKVGDGKYDSSQVIEQSSIWRQGYLKALTELGFDLKGKVHKTVNFTKKADPDEAVRAIASECYKAVRRNPTKNPSIQDIKRSIIAAEWWLLISQRRELGLEINPEEALKTRRNLMRNP